LPYTGTDSFLSGTSSYAVSVAKSAAGTFYGWDSVPVSNVPCAANSSFSVSAVLSNLSDSDTANNCTAGLRFLADTAGSNDNAFAADINIGPVNTGRVRLVQWVNGAATVCPAAAQSNQYLIGNYNANDPYLLAVSGSYNASDQLRHRNRGG